MNTSLGILYIVATPIGNMEDITLRAIKVLNEVDTILCEDTKKSLTLLKKYDIKKPLFSYYKPKEKAKLNEIIKMLEEGKNLALITDAGTPLVSDPGQILVQEALNRGIKVITIPGPSSITAALSISGFPADRFIFEGFLPKKKGQREKRLVLIKDMPHTIVFFVPGRDLKNCLEEILHIFGNRKVCVARELTKHFEEVKINNVEDLLKEIGEVRGEVTLIVSGRVCDVKDKDVDKLKTFLKEHVSCGTSFREILKMEKTKGFKRNELYKLWQELKDGKRKN